MNTDTVRIEKVVFLGTGSAVPVPGKRNMSCLAVVLSTGSSILVDCGEGTQHHLRVCGHLRGSRISAILLTHLHGDHCFGIFGLLHTMAMEGRKDPVLLVGPEGLKAMVEAVMMGSGGWDAEGSFALEFKEIPNSGVEGGEDLVGPAGWGPLKKGFPPERCAGAEPVQLGTHGGVTLQAVPLTHSLPDWGYVFTEPDKPGNLDAAKARSLGVPPGKCMGLLKQGKSVELPDGRGTVSPEEVIGPVTPGRTLAVLQDTCDSRAAVEACRGAACVVHEATFEKAMAEDAVSKGHSTSEMAADFAKECGAQCLVLTHFSARYSSGSQPAKSADGTRWGVEDPAELLGDEAREILGEGTQVVVAKDFMVLRGDKGFAPEPQLAVKQSAFVPQLGLFFKLPEEAEMLRRRYGCACGLCDPPVLDGRPAGGQAG